MNVRQLQQALSKLPPGTKLLAAASDEHDVFEVENVTAETNMRTGELNLIFVVNSNPISTSSADFEPHPAFESDINKWLFA